MNTSFADAWSNSRGPVGRSNRRGCHWPAKIACSVSHFFGFAKEPGRWTRAPQAPVRWLFPARIRLSLVEVHLRLGASTIVSVAREMFALASIYCRISVHLQRPSISIYRTCLSSFCNFALAEKLTTEPGPPAGFLAPIRDTPNIALAANSF
jgi:hypothetical protein